MRVLQIIAFVWMLIVVYACQPDDYCNPADANLYDAGGAAYLDDSGYQVQCYPDKDHANIDR